MGTAQSKSQPSVFSDIYYYQSKVKTNQIIISVLIVFLIISIPYVIIDFIFPENNNPIRNIINNVIEIFKSNDLTSKNQIKTIMDVSILDQKLYTENKIDKIQIKSVSPTTTLPTTTPPTTSPITPPPPPDINISSLKIYHFITRTPDGKKDIRPTIINNIKFKSDTVWEQDLKIINNNTPLENVSKIEIIPCNDTDVTKCFSCSVTNCGVKKDFDYEVPTSTYNNPNYAGFTKCKADCDKNNIKADVCECKFNYNKCVNFACSGDCECFNNFQGIEVTLLLGNQEKLKYTITNPDFIHELRIL